MPRELDRPMPRKLDRPMPRKLAFAFLSAVLTAFVAQEAAAADFISRKAQPFEAATPCADSRLLERVSRRFDHQVRNVPGLPIVGIVGYHDIRQHRYLPAHEDSPISRLYCNATASMTDGQSRKIWYLIEYGQGFASIGDNVEFCVAGFDRWNVYNAHCRILQ